MSALRVLGFPFAFRVREPLREGPRGSSNDARNSTPHPDARLQGYSHHTSPAQWHHRDSVAHRQSRGGPRFCGETNSRDAVLVSVTETQ